MAPEKFYAEWGIDTAYAEAGGLRDPRMAQAPRKVALLQRKASKVGDRLGKTTGWIHRTVAEGQARGDDLGVGYERIDDAGLHVTVDGQDRRDRRSTTW